jgi:hypothetical protein
MKKLIFIAVLFFTTSIFSLITKIEPPFWWTGMNNHQLEIMIYGDGISQYKPSIENTSIKLVEVKRTENKNYLFGF